MANIFSIKQNSYFPPIRAALKDASGFPVPLGGTTVTFRFKKRGGNVPREFVAEIIDEDNAIVSYSWQTGDTALPGDYDGEWIVNYPDDKKSVYPSDTYNTIRIVRSLSWSA